MFSRAGSKNRILDALAKTLMAGAFLHILILIIKTLITGDINILNAFSILEVTFFFPEIGVSYENLLFSFLSLIFIYSIIYFFFTKK